ncbi:hypothetical protein BFJ72_g15052 [Fusarium proliferatum]|uniref:Uncharacterized protein n=1 Tax=Gibberella intermedia TaxID=948311 RepID=A0A420RU41_GIBIN|nr:hypothetical protein BFJ72_g15052 [Fusarium proliferatum]
MDGFTASPATGPTTPCLGMLLLLRPLRLPLRVPGAARPALSSEQRGLALFQPQQRGLGFQPTAKSGQRSIAADHAMAGQDDRQRIASVGRTDRAGRTGLAEVLRQLQVTPGLAERNQCQRLPHPQLERRAAWRQFKVEAAAFAVQELQQLFARFRQRIRAGQVPQVQHGIRAPRPPGLRACFGRAFAQALALRVAEHLLQHKIAGGEGIGLAESAQGDVLRGPRADAGQCHAARYEFFQRLAGTEVELATGTGSGQRTHGGGAAARQADRFQRRLSQHLGRGELAIEFRWHARQVCAIGIDQAPGEGGGRGHADLLSEHGALYGLLVSENNALLMGSLLLFVILALAMWVTRRVDWYALGAELK